jgi:hypothetical protein
MPPKNNRHALKSQLLSPNMSQLNSLLISATYNFKASFNTIHPSIHNYVVQSLECLLLKFCKNFSFSYLLHAPPI